MSNPSQPPRRRNRRYGSATLWRYFQSVLLVLLALVISIPLHYGIAAENLVMLFLAAVVVAAAFLGRGPAILASILSVLAFDYFLVEPRLSLTVADSQYLLTFLGLLTVGLVISTIVARLRSQVEVIRQREIHTAALNSLSRDLTGLVDLDQMLHSVVEHVHQSFGGRVVVLLPVADTLKIAADSSSTQPSSDFLELHSDDLAAAQAIYLQGVPEPKADKAAERWVFLALQTSIGAVGVLGIEPGFDGRLPRDEGQRSLLQGFANLAALAIERARLAEQASQTLILRNTERLQAALLNSISHELRTPLVSITGALSTLMESSSWSQEQPIQQTAWRELLETAYEEARRMNRLVGNLLDMSRLESGAMRLNLEPCDLEDLVGISLDRFSERYHDRQVQTYLDDNLPLIELDMALMVQVMVNLLENAAKYSPKNTTILLNCKKRDERLEIEIHDQGPGIPSEDMGRIFDKFYRSARVKTVGGLGLGLSISKGIVEAHGGQLNAIKTAGGGFSMVIQFPCSRGESLE